MAQDATEKPYFDAREPVEYGSVGPHIIFLEFLRGLTVPAEVKIDLRQEMLVMHLRALCLKHALSKGARRIQRAVNQLCALYVKAVQNGGEKSFRIYAAFVDEYVAVQEQIFLARDQARAENQRIVARTTNLLNLCHELMENAIRKLATLGVYSLDVLTKNARANALDAKQYVDLDLKAKEETFRTNTAVLTETYQSLFGNVTRGVRNSIAHRRYEIREDGTAVLFDLNPRTNERTLVAELSANDLEILAKELGNAADTFEISLVIFQHNHGSVLDALGLYSRETEYTDKKILELLALQAPISVLELLDVTFSSIQVEVSVRTRFDHELGEPPSEVFVGTTDDEGNPLRYKLDVALPRLQVRDQVLGFMQHASFFCTRYSTLKVIVRSQAGEELGEVVAPVKDLRKSVEEHISLGDFLSRLEHNTLPNQD